MLSLVFGSAGSGKTYELRKRMRARAEMGKRSILVVAEQFTSSTELSIIRELGDNLCHYITVADFGRIARMTTEQYGGAMPFVGDAYRVALCRRAVLSLSGQLKYYNAPRYNIGFYSLVADIVKELKMCCTSQQLLEIATDDKLYDIALIYEAYNNLLSGRREPQDLLLAAADSIKKHPDFLEDIAFFIDGFDGFTAPEYEIIKNLLSVGREVSCALNTPSAELEDDFFDTVRTTARRLKRLASDEGVSLSPDTFLYRSRAGSEDIDCLNLLLCGEDVELPDSFNDITLTPYKNITDEVTAAAASIHAEVRGGRRYRDIALVMRNPDMYYSELMKALALFDIPVYLEREDELRFSAPATLISSLISLQAGVNSDDMLTLTATGLCDIPSERLATLRDWILRFNPTAAEWRNGVELSQEDILENRSWVGGEAVRAELMQKISPIYSQTNLVQGIYSAVVNLNVAENLLDDEQQRRYNLTIEILDQLYGLDDEQRLNSEELKHLFDLLLQSTKLHSLPRVADCVTVYSPERIVGEGIRSLYVLGVNGEVFPAEVGHSGLLDHSDRERLAEQDLQLPGLYMNRVMLEELYLYKTLTTPSETLHISYLTENKLSPQLIPIDGIAARLRLGRQDTVATPSAAAVALSKRIYDDIPFSKELKAAILQNGGERLVDAVNSASTLPCFDLKDEEVINKLTRQISLSAGRVSTYRKCAFSYFMRYLLKVEPIRRLELSADIAGTLIHYIMERLMKEQPELTNISDEKLYSMCAEYTAECVDRLFGERVSVKEKFIISRLEQSAAQLLVFLRAEQKDSLFRPERLEQSLSRQITTPDGAVINLRGVVDRIDSCTVDGERYIRVVDYKTGNKTFSLRDVETGIEIQLFLYLFNVMEQGEIPAGAFYLHSIPKEDKESGYSYDGAVLNEEKLLQATCLKHTVIRTKGENVVASGQENRLFDRDKAQRIGRHIDELLFEVAAEMGDGSFDARPIKSSNSPCDYCSYRIICRKVDKDGREKELSSSKTPFI